jgi:hypothetical protein
MTATAQDRRFSVGDAARIVKSAFPANIGRVVRIIRHDEQCYFGPSWEIATDGEPIETNIGPRNRCLAFASSLEPMPTEARK